MAVALAQIGEFSFILAGRGRACSACCRDEGHSLLVACAILSITLNPLLFRAIVPWRRGCGRGPALARARRRSEAGGATLNRAIHARLTEAEHEPPVTAVIVGYGPVGQIAARILKEFGVRPVVVDLNLDTVRGLTERGELAIYGDATQRDILTAAGIREAKYLLLTVPEVLVRTVVILAAKDLNPELRIFARARYLQERAWLEEVGATGVVTEEGETALGLAVLLLREVGADDGRVREEIRRIQVELGSPGVEHQGDPASGHR